VRRHCFAILLPLLLASCAAPRVTPHLSPPNPAPVRTKLAQVKSHGEAAKAAIKENNLKLAGEHVDALLDELTHAQEALKMYDRAVEVQTTIANHAIDDKNTAISDADSAKRRYHRLKFPVSVAGAVLGLVLALRFNLLRFLPPPYNLVGIVALPPLIYGALWIFL
jgi:hypothetical protein